MGQKSILIVDDEELSNRYLELFFEEYYEVHLAKCVDEAIAFLNAGEHDVMSIVTDYYMEPKTGLDLLAWAKANKPEVQRLMMTGYFDSELSPYVNDKTIEVVLHKPFEEEDLLDILESREQEIKNKGES